jgi:hypothetical protein
MEMALIKEIRLPNGVNVNYHRIISIINITNHESIIEVGSYTSKAKREEEKQALQNNEEMNVYIAGDPIPVPYDPDLNIVAAYEYLKTTEKYGGAEDE